MQKLAEDHKTMIMNSLPFYMIHMMFKFKGRLTLAGGCIRAVVAGEEINDFDFFVDSLQTADEIEKLLGSRQGISVKKTKNTTTYRLEPLFPGDMYRSVQIVTRWLYATPEDIINSFDFTICQAAMWYDGLSFDSTCSIEFYSSVENKKLIYTQPIRDEECAGSMLRVLKFIKGGYHIDKHNLSLVIARMVCNSIDTGERGEENVGNSIFTKLCEAAHVRY